MKLEPWRCEHCQELIYNLKDGYPAKGAPFPMWYSIKFQKVCLTCFEMANAAGTDYMRDLSQKESRDRERNRSAGT